MGETTGISWTDSTWTPIRARVKENAGDIARAKGYGSLVKIAERMAGRVGPHCERVSPGCGDSTGGGCYSEANNGRCLPSNGTGLPFDRRARDLVDVFVDEKILMQPLHWRKPRRIFVCSQTDLFGEFVSFEAIDEVFTVMAAAPQHTYQILTKRAERMLEYFHSSVERGCYTADQQQIWLGVSVEDRKRKDRIDLLRQAPAALRFLSLEPLLEDLGELDLTGIGWVIVGGESGPGARPMDIAWVRSIVAQCKAAGVSCFVKQMGSNPMRAHNGSASDTISAMTGPHRDGVAGKFVPIILKDHKGGDMSEWPADLRVREFPEVKA